HAQAQAAVRARGGIRGRADGEPDAACDADRGMGPDATAGRAERTGRVGVGRGAADPGSAVWGSGAGFAGQRAFVTGALARSVPSQAEARPTGRRVGLK